MSIMLKKNGLCVGSPGLPSLKLKVKKWVVDTSERGGRRHWAESRFIRGRTGFVQSKMR